MIPVHIDDMVGDLGDDRCCFCDRFTKTHYRAANVPLCRGCALLVEEADLPTRDQHLRRQRIAFESKGHDGETATPGRARDLLLKHLHFHGQNCPEAPGECREVGNLLAFFAHTLGANEEDIKAFPKLLVEYDMGCQGCESRRHDA